MFSVIRTDHDKGYRSIFDRLETDLHKDPGHTARV